MIREANNRLALQILEQAMKLNPMIEEDLTVEYAGYVNTLVIRIADPGKEVKFKADIKLNFSDWGEWSDEEIKEFEEGSNKNLEIVLEKLNHFVDVGKIDESVIEERRILSTTNKF